MLIQKILRLVVLGLGLFSATVMLPGCGGGPETATDMDAMEQGTAPDAIDDEDPGLEDDPADQG